MSLHDYYTGLAASATSWHTELATSQASDITGFHHTLLPHTCSILITDLWQTDIWYFTLYFKTLMHVFIFSVLHYSYFLNHHHHHPLPSSPHYLICNPGGVCVHLLRITFVQLDEPSYSVSTTTTTLQPRGCLYSSNTNFIWRSWWAIITVITTINPGVRFKFLSLFSDIDPVQAREGLVFSKLRLQFLKHFPKQPTFSDWNCLFKLLQPFEVLFYLPSSILPWTRWLRCIRISIYLVEDNRLL